MSALDASVTTFCPLNAATLTDAATSDLTVLFKGQNYARRIYVGVTGDVQVTFLGGATVVYKAFPAGQWITGVLTSVVSTLTTATKLIAEQ